METPAPRCCQPPPAPRSRAGFTLVEVCIALGIIAFAVLPLIGLLSIGLDSYRNAVTRARASQVLAEISTALQEATMVTGTTTTGVAAGTYVALPPFPQPNATPNPNLPSGFSATPIEWTAPGATPSPTPYTVSAYFDENGTFLADKTSTTDTPSIPSSLPSSPPPSGARIVAAIVVTPPTSNYTAGTAQITVGWPATPQSGPTYVAPSFSYGTVQGHVENTIILPAIPAQQ